MKPRDYVLEQIQHHATSPIPFTLDFEGDVAERLDAYYGGGSEWRDRLTPYIVTAGVVDTSKSEKIDEEHQRDAFGTIWRTDRRPVYLERPGLEAPSFDGYDFPRPEVFLDAETQAAARKRLEEHPDSFRAACIGWGLH